MSSFLTPERKPFFAGTYFPKEGRHGLPSFMEVLKKITLLYGTKRADIEKSSDEMRSFAEEIIHIIQANYGMMSTALEVENPNKSKLEFTSKEAIIGELINCYDFVIDNLKSFDEKKLDEIITVFGKYEYSRERVISKVYEHQAHHKSKSIVIQRYLGVTPPGYMLF